MAVGRASSTRQTAKGLKGSFVWTLLIAIVLVGSLASILYNPIWINHDSALYLQEGSLILHGRLLYVDLIELNPPLIVYLNAIPAAASDLLHTHPIVTFLVGVWLLTAASVIATRRILRGSPNDDGSVNADLVALALAIVSARVLLTNNYGQREHLFVLGFFPYFALRFRRWEGGRVAIPSAIVAGVLAAVGACLKPHFVAIAVVPEIYWLTTRRSGRPLVQPETIAFAGAGLLYALHFLVLPEPMRAAYFGRWIPFMSQGYHAYDQPIRLMIVGATTWWLSASICVLVFVLRPARSDGASRCAKALALAGLVATLSFFVQHKGWVYHVIPAHAAAFVVIALTIGRWRRTTMGVDNDASPPVRFMAAAHFTVLPTLLGGASLLVIAFALHPKSDQRLAEWTSGSPLRRSIVRHSERGDAVLFINTSVGPEYPILTQLERTPGSRYPVAFPIPMFYLGVRARPGEPFPYHDAATISADELMFHAELRADIRRLRPRVILIREKFGCQACPEGFDLHEYMIRKESIGDALNDYRHMGSVEGYALYLPAS